MPITKSKGKKPNFLKVEADSSESDGNSSEHELFYYKKDKVKLMKEVLKLIKPKKIKQMAPDCIKHLDIAEINSMLLEELLGISNKRLQYIFNGENVDRDSSSSDSDEDKAIDVISLDDISSDDEILCLDDVKDDPKTKSTKIQSPKRRHKHRHHKVKQEQPEVSPDKQVKRKKVKREKDDPPKESEKDKLMSVLEILELQARARAIKSQLLLETQAKKQAAEQEASTQVDDGSDSDVLIEEVGGTEEIVITSESENETNTSSSEKVGESVEEKKNRLEKRIQKRIRLKRNTLNNKESDPETPVPDVPNILEGTEDGTIDQYNRLLALNDKNGTTSEATQENVKQDAPDNQGKLENKDSAPISNDKMEENENIQKEATEISTEKDITSVDKAEEGEIIEYQEDCDNKAEEGEIGNKSAREDTSSDKDLLDTKKPENKANPEVSVETNDGDCAIIINLDDDEIDEMNNA